MAVPSIAGDSVKRSGGSVIHVLIAAAYLSVTAEMTGPIRQSYAAGGAKMWQFTQT
jgi:hypothetical protein